MKINSLNSTVSFKRALTKEELTDYGRVLQQARGSVGGEGKSILIVHDTCLPQNEETDTGIGHLTSDTSGKFFDFVKSYWGINTIEVLPPGEIQLKGNKSFYNTYNGSALSLGSQNINLELLVKEGLLPVQEFNNVVSNNNSTKKAGLANYENVIGENTPYEDALKIAYENFVNDKKPERLEEKAKFEEYKKENSDWLERKAIYYALKEKNGGRDSKDWIYIERDLYKETTGKFNNAKVQQVKEKYKEKIKNKYAKQIDFYMFKQYLADKHLALGRKSLNEKGMKLFGDCLIGFSQDEIWAYDSAFKKDEKGNPVYIGDPDWKLPALNYSEITKDGSAANKLLKRKVELFAKRYDGIRFDCSWSYVSPRLSDNSKYEFKDTILSIIEDTVKKVKGDNYKKEDLIHEFEAGPKDFSIMNFDKKVKSYLRDRVKVIGEAHMSDDYGTTAAMEKMGASKDSYIIGVGNHDPQPLRQIAESVPEKVDGKRVLHKLGHEKVLKKIFGVSAYELQTPEGFSQYKFAEPLMAKNQMIFYMDAFGRSERFDSQQENGENNYRYRIPEDYAKKYQEAVQSGFGYNPMDGYSKVFKTKGLDVSKSDLYKKIVQYSNILKQNPDAAVVETTPEKKNIDTKKVIGTAVGVAALIAAVIAGADSGLQSQLNGEDFTLKL